MDLRRQIQGIGVSTQAIGVSTQAIGVSTQGEGGLSRWALMRSTRASLVKKHLPCRERSTKVPQKAPRKSPRGGCRSPPKSPYIHQERVAERRGASARVTVTPTAGMSSTRDRARAVASPTRRPVNDPGPVVTAMRSKVSQGTPLSFCSRSSSGARASAWPCFICRLSPVGCACPATDRPSRRS